MIRDARRASPVVIIGAGVAGLSAALAIEDRPVLILTRGHVRRGSASALAQGGIAAAIGDDDSPELHAADTIAAGGARVRVELARLLASSGPAEIERLIALGAEFERDARGRLVLGREAAHSRSRIVHAGGDETGREVMRVLGRAVSRRPNVQVSERTLVVSLVVSDGRVRGVDVRVGGGPVSRIATDAVLLATGGVGALWETTTNPVDAVGSGLVLAARAGASLVDLEFVQFHPTALDVATRPAPLLSEALRGAGAVLVDGSGRPLRIEHPDGSLAPRDVVARAVAAERARSTHAFLDARSIDVSRRFPAAAAAIRAAGFDPARDLVPVRPAAHFHMGGVAVDDRGTTGIEGLRAAGEVACSGLHGANRLASNSLLEGLVFGRRAGEALVSERPPTGAAPHADSTRRRTRSQSPTRARVGRLLDAHVGVIRTESGLRRALETLVSLPGDEAWVGAAITAAALRRRESVGAHHRSDPFHSGSLECASAQN